MARRGQASYNEDDLVDYDVLDYDIEVAATPDRQWIDGRARLRLKVRAYVLGTLTLRLADPLIVQSIVSYEYGRLFGIRVKNQNTLVVNLPTTLTRDSVLTLTIAYAGRLEPQAPERETIAPFEGQQRATAEDVPMLMQPEPSYLYSSRSYWYPQAPVSDYATARIRISGAARRIDCVASGELEPGFPTDRSPARSRRRTASCTSSRAAQPLRYLAFILSRFARAETTTIAFPAPQRGRRRPEAARLTRAELSGTVYRSLNLSVETNPRQVQRGRELAERAADIAHVLRIDRRRLAVFELHRRADRKRPARRPQPRLFRGAEPAAADVGAGRGATIRRRSRAIPISSSRTSSRTSGGARRSAGATTTSSGSARASRSTSPRCTRSTSAATKASPPC